MEGGTNMSLELSIADKLSMLRLYEWQGFSVPVKPADFHIEAATMLRQQQAEIEALKLQLHTTLTNRDLRTYDGKLEMNVEPVAWLLFRDGGESYPEYTTSYKQMREWETYLGDNERIEPHYTHPAKNNGGNPEELNTRQIQDARTSLESTPPFAYAVVSKECPDNMENMSLQFNEPVDAKKVIPLYERPIDVTDEEIWAVANDYFVGKSDLVYGFARAILRKAQEKCQ